MNKEIISAVRHGKEAKLVGKVREKGKRRLIEELAGELLFHSFAKS